MSNPISNTSVHDQIIAMLPWFVNKTLEANQRKAVLRHIEHCADCQREIQFLTQLSESVQDDAYNSHSMNADVDRSLASVMERIDAKSRQSNSITSGASSLQQKLGEMFTFSTTLSFPQWSATAIAGLLVAILGFQFYSRQADDNYSVLSSSDPQNSVMRLSVEMTATGDQEQVQAIIQSALEKLGQPINLEMNPDGAYVIIFNQSVGIGELSEIVIALENETQIERVEVLP